MTTVLWLNHVHEMKYQNSNAQSPGAVCTGTLAIIHKGLAAKGQSQVKCRSTIATFPLIYLGKSPVWAQSKWSHALYVRGASIILLLVWKKKQNLICHLSIRSN